MSQKRTTTYTCDRCDTQVSRKADLRRFQVTNQKYDRVAFDLCEPCETPLIEFLSGCLPLDTSPETLRRG